MAKAVASTSTSTGQRQRTPRATPQAVVMTIAMARRDVSSGETDQVIEATTISSSRIRNGCPARPFSAEIGRVPIRARPTAYVGKNITRSIVEPVSLTP